MDCYKGTFYPCKILYSYADGGRLNSAKARLNLSQIVSFYWYLGMCKEKVNIINVFLFKVALASSSFLFLLLLEGHNWKKRGTPRYSYITSVCAKTGIEIFDSVSMLAILMEGPDLSKIVRDFILALASVNFLLPAIKLYQLR